jgi:hypothetical protein
MIDAGVAEKLPSPVWMDTKRDLCTEVDADGCKFQTNLKRPDLCIVTDEVSVNTRGQVTINQEGQTLHMSWSNYFR